MNRKLQESLIRIYQNEIGGPRLHAGQGRAVALVYPNSYYVGMSNLGFQIIYKEINDRSDTMCERVFMPERKELEEYVRTNTPLMSIETQRPLYQFEVIGIDITFEMDYFNIPKLLRMGKIPLYSKDRTDRDSYVVLGGPCATFNPEPLADFVDICIIGEGEELIGNVLDALFAAKAKGLSRKQVLAEVAKLSGVYVPSLYQCEFDGIKQLSVSPIDDAPLKVERHWAPLVTPGETVISTDYTEFGNMYIVEVARGCGRHCRFCMAGYCYRTPRSRPLDMLKEGVDRAAKLGKKVGLMGAAISDYPQIDELIEYIRSKDLPFSCASLRADTLTQTVAEGLAASGQKTMTIAPEAGSERLRRVINKGIGNDELLRAVDKAALAGIPHVRLYIMVGLPTETEEDIVAIGDMADELQAHMPKVGCKGRLTLSINPFIPKPFTPFQWMPMANRKSVEDILNSLKKRFQKNKYIEILAESPKEAYIQGVLSRGDRRIGAILAQCDEENGSKSFMKVCKQNGYDTEAALYREREVEECLPWQILDMGLSEGYLYREYVAAMSETYTAPCMDGCRRCGVCK